MNADFSAPYFHDGRFDNYAQVIDYFDRVYDLALNAQDRADIAAYLTVIGDGVRPEYHLTGTNVLEDIDGFAGVLDIAISSHDTQVVAFAVRSVSDLLQDLAERYPDPKNQAISGGVQERLLARAMRLRRCARFCFESIGMSPAAGSTRPPQNTSPTGN